MDQDNQQSTGSRQRVVSKTSSTTRGFDHRAIDAKWQARWDSEQRFATPTDVAPGKKRYVLDMFPYPSGAGLHVGHPLGYIGSDVLARLLRAQGYSVLHPMGWDAFGLPAENYAIQTGTPPATTTQASIDRYREQLKLIGLTYDWSRELNTSDPSYYRWTQWLFLQLFKNGLAYQKEAAVNWCPKDQTVLANEQVQNGVCERCGSMVEQRSMKQWFFKITDSADELLSALDDLDWPEPIKLMQRNWIGKSQGAELDFPIDGRAESITVFTTRADTLYGATYLVLAPEHALVSQLTTGDRRAAVEAYVVAAGSKKELDRKAIDRPKTGVFTGSFAIHPATNERLPIWIADYVLTAYGTGAIMAVPAHDERDYAFATANDLPVTQVVAPDVIDETNPPRADRPNTEREIVHAILLDKAGTSFVALRSKTQPWLTMITGGIEPSEDPVAAATREILEETGYQHVRYLGRLPYLIHAKFYAAHKTVNRAVESHVLKFQIIDDEQEPLSDEEASLHTIEWLPLDQLHTLHPMSELEHIVDWFANGDRPYLGEGTLINSGQFSGLTSSQAQPSIIKAVGGRITTRYKLRDWLVSRQRYWGAPIPIIHCGSCGAVPVPDDQLPVTLPTDVDFLPTGESPLARSVSFKQTSCPNCQGAAERETDTMDTFVDSSWYYLRYVDPTNDSAMFDPTAAASWLPVDWYVGGAEHAVLHLLYSRFITKALADQSLLSFREPFLRLRNQGLIRADDGRKMSKRWGNVINPDDVIGQYGADTLRCYEMFMGPFADSMPWSTRSMVGVRRWLDRVWTLRMIVSDDLKSAPLMAKLDRTIHKVGHDIQAFKFNTAVSALMEFTNAAGKEPALPRSVWERFLLILNPFAPHLAAELWDQLNPNQPIDVIPWPTTDEGALTMNEVTIAVQVGGRTRATLTVPSSISEPALVREARALPGVQRHLPNEPIRTVVIPGRIVNFIP